MAKSTKLLMDRGRVSRPLGDVCKGGEIRVAYNNAVGWYLMDWNDKMVEYEYDGSQSINHVTFPHEILSSFYNKNQLNPTYVYNYQDVGSVDPRRHGTLGMVSEDIIALLLFKANLKFFHSLY